MNLQNLRFRHECIRLPALWAIVVFAAEATAFAQGPLNPTSGPTPTMKSLDQIEPRTLISSLPFTINSPGSYYLTQNLTATGSGTGITVNASNVTIDLKGFTLTGGGGGVLWGINVSGTQKNLCVRNGSITGWSYGGVNAQNATGSLYEDLLISNSGSTALGLWTGDDCIVRSCVLENVGQQAIQGGNHCVVLHCTASGCSGSGIFISTGTVADCVTDGNGGIGIYIASGRAVDCWCSNNGNDGFFSPSQTTISGLTATNNGANGIEVYGSSCVSNCTAQGNKASGITVGGQSIVRSCLAQGNAASGIYATNNCILVGNNCSSNNTANNSANSGIYATGTGTTIDSNTCVANGNGIGITSLGTHNIIFRNTCSSNPAGNYNIPGTGSANTIGPVVDMHAGGTISNTNPWTNWIY